jgi:hypothetical protein
MKQISFVRERGMGARARILAVVVVALVALMAVAAPVGARASSASTNVTLTATVTSGGFWCCGSFVDFEGEAVVPRVGPVAYTGRWLAGCLLNFPFSTPCFRRLEIDFVSRNGDLLALRGNNEWNPPGESAPTVLTWIIDPAASTGRFSEFSGSGTYTFARDGSSVTISLSGLMQPAGAS